MNARLTTLALLFIIAVSPKSALAEIGDTENRAMEHDQRAAELFEAESYAEALTEFTRAQELLPATERIYNMAVCHERLDQLTEAVSMFQRFIDAPNSPEDRRGRARARIEAIRSQLEGQGVSDPSPEQPEPVATTVGEGPTADQSEQTDVATTPSRRRLAPGAFWGLLGSTLAVTVAFAVTGGIAIGHQNDFVDTEVNSVEGQDARDQGWPLAVATDVLIATASVLAVATLIVGLFTNFDREREVNALRHDRAFELARSSAVAPIPHPSVPDSTF